MDSGWAQFRVLYDFVPREARDIAIHVGDIMIVAKPVQDYSDWLTGENTRTHEVGEFPGTYVEYIGDIIDLPQAQDEISTPPIPPPRPPRIAKPGELYAYAVLDRKLLHVHYKVVKVFEHFISFSLKGAGTSVVPFTFYLKKESSIHF